MISILLALAATAQVPDEARFRSCADLVKKDAPAAVSEATRWRLAGGGSLARQCLGLAYTELQRWAPAATAFEQAARDAAAASDPRAADFHVQAGNAWLAADDPAKAIAAFDAALATRHLTDELRGEVHLDRARARVAAGDVKAARTDIQEGLKLVPRDPFAWYLSSALALREGASARASADIAKALELAPDDASVRLQAGNVAVTIGDFDSARRHYERAAAIAPQSEAGKAAAAALTAPPPPLEQ